MTQDTSDRVVTLFGGPADGDRQQVPAGSPYLYVPVHEHPGYDDGHAEYVESDRGFEFRRVLAAPAPAGREARTVRGYDIKPTGWSVYCSKCHCLVGLTLDSEQEAEAFAESIEGLCDKCAGWKP